MDSYANSIIKKEATTLRDYSEDEIRQAVNDVIAAGMEKFLFQEPFSSSRKCSHVTGRDHENDE